MRRSGKNTLAIFALVLVFAGVAGAWLYSHPGNLEKIEKAITKNFITSKNKKGLQFRLSEGDAEVPTAVPIAKATQLSDAEAETLLNRLEPLKADEEDKQEFALRENSLPPPKTGEVIATKFPPDKNTKPDEVVAGPLQVLRYSPKENVQLAPNISITFSQPMVALTSQEDASKTVPVKLTPQPPGSWRWLGTKTLVFEPKDNRLPMATEYLVEVLPGTKSATGQSLQTPVSWKFKTPTLTLKQYYPTSTSVNTNPLFVLEFDQVIDKNALLNYISMSGANKTYKFRLATDSEIQEEAEKNVEVKNLLNTAKDKYWLALKVDSTLAGNSTEPLPKDTDFVGVVGIDTPSTEGPLTTTTKQEFRFRTYSPLKVIWNSCKDYECQPSGYLQFSLNNPLKQNSLDVSKATMEPKLPGMSMTVYGTTIMIRGKLKGKRTYKLKLEKEFIKDTFGQYLDHPEEISFPIAPAAKQLSSLGGEFLVLDPFGPAKLPVFTTNHNELKVSIYSVSPEEWKDFIRVRQEISEKYNDPTAYQRPVGSLLYSKVVTPANQADEQVETDIDLTTAFQNGRNQAFVLVEPTNQTSKNYWERQYIRKWVQYTQIGLDAAIDQEEMLVWANSLKTGKPLAGVEVSLRGSNAVTGADGIAHLKLEDATPKDAPVLIAKSGKDTAILPPPSYGYYAGNWVKTTSTDSLSWYVVDDRKTYKPGEKVTIKGWVRLSEAKKGGDIKLAGQIKTVDYTLTDSQGNKISTGTAQVNPLGGFNTEFTLPGTMNLGNAYLALQALPNAYGNQAYSHSFQVQEFRRPEFEVSTKADGSAYLIGEHANVTVSANYYAGGTLNNADVNWQATATPTTYTPPNRGEYTFGKWTPWWESYNVYEGYGRRGRYGVENSEDSGNNSESFVGKTSPTGTHNLRIDFDAVNPASPTSLNVQASVSDVNRQTWTSSSTLLIHPSSLYVGLKSEKTFVGQNEPLIIKSIVTNIDGKIISNTPIELKLVRIDYGYDDQGRYQTKELDPQTKTITSSDDAVEVKFLPKEGGSYKLTATIVDQKGLKNQTEIRLWVSGGKTLPNRDLTQEKIQLIPDKKEYAVGQTAQILLQAPFYPAEALLTLRRSGLVKSERFSVDSPTYTIKVPIEEGYLPNIDVQVDLVGESERNPEATNSANSGAQLLKRPAFAVGHLNLSIPPVSRTLTVEATPKQKAIEPGGETTIDLKLTDASKNAVANAEVALFVVDEAILALSNYQISNPLGTFYAQRPTLVTDDHLRSSVVLSNPEDIEAQEQLAQNKAGGGGGSGRREMAVPEESDKMAMADGIAANVMPAAKPAAPAMEMEAKVSKDAAPARMERARTSASAEAPKPTGTPIRVRENFNALAVFEAALSTDNNGHAEVKVKLPDSLTRYRIMAIAVAGENRFGSGESTLTARMPLMVRPSAPRFLNFGDKFEFPVVVQNQTDAPMSVDVAMRATNATLTQGLGRRVSVPANERVEVRFPVSAEMAGKARFQIGIASGKWTDAAQVALPVWTPATTEAFATYGTFESNAIIQPVKAPSDSYKQFGGLEVSTSSTQLQELTDAVLYIVSYPYECSEQVSSRVLTIAALRDVLAAFKAKGLPKQEDLEARVAKDVAKLKNLQGYDGGFGFWRPDNSNPFVTVHVAHALQLAKLKGYPVPQDMLDRAHNYLRNIEAYLGDYSEYTRISVISYSLYVRNQMGDKDIAKAKSIINSRPLEKLPMETIGWLWSVLTGDAGSKKELEAIRTFVNNRATETAATAHFVTNYDDSSYLLLASDFRTDAILLDALLGDQPNSDLIPKLVRGLLDHRKAGKWESTQENVFVLLALDRYFRTYEKVTPNFVAKLWLGDRYAGEHSFIGRTTEKYQVNIPMNYLTDKGEQNLVIAKEGTGRIYYRAAMSYAPLSLDLAAADYGFVVERKYEAVDNPSDVTKEKDGTWRIKAGARVRVKLTMVAQSRRYHVALVDPLPAGLEALNPALATTGAIPPDPKPNQEESASRYYWWSGLWYQHQNFRDERIEAFTTLLWDGVYSYSYVARATTIGNFVVPPTKAEEMYHPETFGRSKTDKVVVYEAGK